MQNCSNFIYKTRIRVKDVNASRRASFFLNLALPLLHILPKNRFYFLRTLYSALLFISYARSFDRFEPSDARNIAYIRYKVAYLNRCCSIIFNSDLDVGYFQNHSYHLSLLWVNSHFVMRPLFLLLLLSMCHLSSFPF